jgi:hypothetical protein
MMKGQSKEETIARKALVLCDVLATRMDSLELAIQQLRDMQEVLNTKHEARLTEAIGSLQPIEKSLESPKRGPGRPRKGDEARRDATSSDRAA